MTGPLTAITLLFAATMTIMAGATIAPALPAMVDHFGADAALGVRLLLTITALAIALTAPVAGWLGDRAGRVRVLWVSVTLYILAGGAGLVLNDLLALQISRVLLGIAVAGVMTSVGALIGDLYDGPARDRMLGLQGAAMGLGGVVFLGLGGVLAGLGWRGPFAIYVLPLVLLVLIPLALPQKPVTDARPQVPDASVASVPLPILAALLGAAFLGMVGFYAVPVQLPFLLAERGGDNPALSGAMMAGLTLVSAVVGIFYGRFSKAASLPVLGIAAFAGLSAGLVLIWAGPAMIWPGVAAIGFGMGLLMPTLSRWLLSLAPPAARGRIMGAQTTAIFAGQFASPLVLAPVISVAGLPAAFLAAAALAACACLLIALAGRQSPVQRST